VNTWLSEKDGNLTIEIKVVPRASKSEIAGIEGDCLKVRLKAAPVEGEANSELIALFHKLLKIPRENIVIKRGSASKHKSLLIKGISTEEVLKTLSV